MAHRARFRQVPTGVTHHTIACDRRMVPTGGTASEQESLAVTQWPMGIVSASSGKPQKARDADQGAKKHICASLRSSGRHESQPEAEEDEIC